MVKYQTEFKLEVVKSSLADRARPQRRYRRPEGKGLEILATDERIAAPTAWKNKRVFYLDAPAWCIATGGYLGLRNGAEDMHKARTAAQ